MLDMHMWYSGDFRSWTRTEYDATPQRILDAQRVITSIKREVSQHRTTAAQVDAEARRRNNS